ncbi:hypothetical protein [Streptomyces decoyicus]|uniref:hypothetical protein n=1 Tax=Streptomyces decoyicus TaxID=249567 RepID=UPI00386B9C88
MPVPVTGLLAGRAAADLLAFAVRPGHDRGLRRTGPRTEVRRSQLLKEVLLAEALKKSRRPGGEVRSGMPIRRRAIALAAPDSGPSSGWCSG